MKIIRVEILLIVIFLPYVVVNILESNDRTDPKKQQLSKQKRATLEFPLSINSTPRQLKYSNPSPTQLVQLLEIPSRKQSSHSPESLPQGKTQSPTYFPLTSIPPRNKASEPSGSNRSKAEPQDGKFQSKVGKSPKGKFRFQFSLGKLCKKVTTEPKRSECLRSLQQLNENFDVVFAPVDLPPDSLADLPFKSFGEHKCALFKSQNPWYRCFPVSISLDWEATDIIKGLHFYGDTEARYHLSESYPGSLTILFNSKIRPGKEVLQAEIEGPMPPRASFIKAKLVDITATLPVAVGTGSLFSSGQKQVFSTNSPNDFDVNVFPKKKSDPLLKGLKPGLKIIYDSKNKEYTRIIRLAHSKISWRFAQITGLPATSYSLPPHFPLTSQFHNGMLKGNRVGPSALSQKDIDTLLTNSRLKKVYKLEEKQSDAAGLVPMFSATRNRKGLVTLTIRLHRGGIARVGDEVSHGGKILEGSATVFVNGKPVARQGDSANCGEGRVGIINNGIMNVLVEGKPVATSSHDVDCGGVILDASHNAEAGIRGLWPYE